MDKTERLSRLADAFPLAGEQTDPTPDSEPRTYDYTRRYWGHDYMTIGDIGDGLTLNLGVFGQSFRVGDFLILQQGAGSTRYRITEIRDHPGDPGDLWFVTAEFAPRGSADA